MLSVCQNIATLMRDAREIGDFEEWSFGMTIVHYLSRGTKRLTVDEGKEK